MSKRGGLESRLDRLEAHFIELLTGMSVDETYALKSRQNLSLIGSELQYESQGWVLASSAKLERFIRRWPPQKFRQPTQDVPGDTVILTVGIPDPEDQCSRCHSDDHRWYRKQKGRGPARSRDSSILSAT